MVESLAVDMVHLLDRHRTVDEKAVDRLAESMKSIGLQTPITVRHVEEDMVIDGEVVSGVAVLVAGAHRLAAAKKLGWERIDCVEIEGGELQAELWEIDENLMRAELSPAEEAAHLKRRKEIWEEIENIGKSFSEKAKPGRPTQFASDTASSTGRTKQSINQHIRRAEALGDDITRIKGTSLDKGVELDALSKMDEQERRELIERAHAGERVTARKPVMPPAEPLNDWEARNKWWAEMNRVFGRAPQEWREQWLAEQQAPVMDTRYA